MALCCDDWRGEYKIGNIVDTPLDELWQHPRFVAARRALYAANRGAISVCAGCDVRTYRNGLLPDKMGKEKVLPLSIHDRGVIKQAQHGKVFSLKLLTKGT